MSSASNCDHCDYEKSKVCVNCQKKVMFDAVFSAIIALLKDVSTEGIYESIRLGVFEAMPDLSYTKDDIVETISEGVCAAFQNNYGDRVYAGTYNALVDNMCPYTNIDDAIEKGTKEALKDNRKKPKLRS